MTIEVKKFKLASDYGRMKLTNLGVGVNTYARPESSVYITADGSAWQGAAIIAAMGLNDAIAFRDHLNAVIEDLREHLPKVPTNVERIEAFPVGTRFTVAGNESDNDPAIWVRTYRGISGEVEDHVPVNNGILGFWNDLIVTKIEETS